MNNKLVFNVVVSTLLLLPVSVLLENSDDLETVDSIQGYLKEWISPIILSSILSGIIYGVKKILKKETSFFKIFYYTSYTLSILILLILSLKYF